MKVCFTKRRILYVFTTGSFAIFLRPSPVYICHSASISRGHVALSLLLEDDLGCGNLFLTRGPHWITTIGVVFYVYNYRA